MKIDYASPNLTCMDKGSKGDDKADKIKTETDEKATLPSQYIQCIFLNNLRKGYI